MNKLVNISFNLSLLFGGIAAFLCAGIVYNRIFMIASLLFGFLGFGLCCLHIVVTQRDENIKAASGPMLLLSLFLNSAPLLCMILLIVLAKHGR